MSTRRKRWVFWSGLACFTLGAIIAPLFLLLQALSSLVNAVNSGGSSGGIDIIAFTYFDDAWNIRGNSVWFLTAWIGASLGGVIGIIFSFAITKLKKL